MKLYFPSLIAITAFSENIMVSFLFSGFEILIKIHPTINASTIVPSKHLIENYI